MFDYGFSKFKKTTTVWSSEMKWCVTVHIFFGNLILFSSENQFNRSKVAIFAGPMDRVLPKTIWKINVSTVFDEFYRLRIFSYINE